MKCMHEIEWDTCIYCRSPGYHKPGDRLTAARFLCDQHGLTTPDEEVEACIWCWMADQRPRRTASGASLLTRC